MFEVTVLSILQGIAEFLPISSSGHLVLAQELLGVNEPGMRLDVFLHLGTLVSICVFYFATIRRIVTSFDWRFVAKIAVSALPAVIVYGCFKDRIELAFESPRTVGAMLMFTGAVLIGTRYIPKGVREVSFLHALIMGCAQAVALLPGVSRSGMTLVAARSSKVEPEKSAEFSFLMSAPLIAGAAMLEVIKSLGADVATDGEASWALVAYGLVISAIVGYFSLKFLVRSLKSRGFWLYGIYCIVAGLVTLFVV